MSNIYFLSDINSVTFGRRLGSKDKTKRRLRIGGALLATAGVGLGVALVGRGLRNKRVFNSQKLTSPTATIPTNAPSPNLVSQAPPKIQPQSLPISNPQVTPPQITPTRNLAEIKAKKSQKIQQRRQELANDAQIIGSKNKEYLDMQTGNMINESQRNKIYKSAARKAKVGNGKRSVNGVTQNQKLQKLDRYENVINNRFQNMTTKYQGYADQLRDNQLKGMNPAKRKDYNKFLREQVVAKTRARLGANYSLGGLVTFRRGYY